MKFTDDFYEEMTDFSKCVLFIKVTNTKLYGEVDSVALISVPNYSVPTIYYLYNKTKKLDLANRKK